MNYNFVYVHHSQGEVWEAVELLDRVKFHSQPGEMISPWVIITPIILTVTSEKDDILLLS